MATRSFIRMELPTGEKRSIYCHYDGYPSHNGAILAKYYNTTEKVKELLALGDLSVLGPKPNPNPEFAHSFGGPKQKDVCVAYHRDRDEELRFSEGKDAYNYLWNGRGWFLEDGMGNMPLNPEL